MNTKRNLTTEPVQTVHIGFRVPEDLAENFERVASENERTVSAELRHLMRQHIEQVEAAA